MTTQVLIFNHGPNPFKISERSRDSNGRFNTPGDPAVVPVNGYTQRYVYAQLDLLVTAEGGTEFTAMNLGPQYVEIDYFDHDETGKIINTSDNSYFLAAGETSEGHNGSRARVFGGQQMVFQEWIDERA